MQPYHISALETLVTMRYINLHLPLPLPWSVQGVQIYGGSNFALLHRNGLWLFTEQTYCGRGQGIRWWGQKRMVIGASACYGSGSVVAARKDWRSVHCLRVHTVSWLYSQSCSNYVVQKSSHSNYRTVQIFLSCRVTNCTALEAFLKIFGNCC